MHNSSLPSNLYPTRPCRRWLQFSLRTLLLVMVSIGCFSAWLGQEYRQGQSQKAAIAWVEKMGGSISYEQPGVPRSWRRRLLPGFFPEPVVEIKLCLENPCHVMRNDQVTHIQPLADLPDLRSLDIRHTAVADLSPLAQLEHLEEILAESSRLRNITPLANAKSLNTLSLTFTQVSDLSSLAGNPSLRTLYLNNMSRLTELSPLAQVPNLSTLTLNGTPVSDLTPLAQLHHLRQLHLNGSKVSDITPLHGIASLKSLGLRSLGGRVTFEDAQAVQLALPECQIGYDLILPPLKDSMTSPYDSPGMLDGELAL